MTGDTIDHYFSGAIAALVALGLILSLRVPMAAFNRLIQLFLILYLVHVFNGAAISADLNGILIHWFKIPYVINAAIVSSAFLYLQKLIRNERNWKRTDLIFAVPPVLVFIVMLPFYTLSGSEKRAIWEGLRNHGVFVTHEAVAAGIIAVSILVFQIRQIIAYRRFRNGAFWSSNAAQSEEILRWIRFVNNIIGILAALSLVYVGLRAFGEVQAINGMFRMVFYGTDLVLLMYIALHPRIFEGLPAEHVPKVKTGESPIIDVAQRIQDTKSFLDPELSLYRFALELGIAPPVLSQIIREQTRMNFSQFVNTYRVEHCKKLLLESGLQRHTIEALGLMSGFASRASFYRAFQQLEQCSPKEWLAKQPIQRSVQTVPL
jgi:AraC-like DNA-binding protein